MKILAIDLGSSKSVYGLSGSLGDQPRHGSVATIPAAFHDLIVALAPDRVVIEVGAQAGWVCDLCLALGVPCDVANTADEMLPGVAVEPDAEEDRQERCRPDAVFGPQ